MKRYLTAHDLANQMLMNRSLHSGPIILIEGDTDLRVYQRFFNTTQSILLPSNGKDNAIRAVELVEREGDDKVLAIIDADHWYIDNISPKSSHIFMTDSHDLETMILTSGALEKLLSEFAADYKINNLHRPIRDMLLKNALPVGYLRWLASPSQLNLQLRFKGLPFDQFIDKKTFSINIQSLIKTVRFNSKNAHIDINLVQSKINELLKKNAHDPWKVCAGHDLVHILAFGLRHAFGNERAANIDYLAVDAILRLSFEHKFFRMTQLFEKLRSWDAEYNNNNLLRYDS